MCVCGEREEFCYEESLETVNHIGNFKHFGIEIFIIYSMPSMLEIPYFL